MNDELKGGCLCGTVRYVASGSPVNARVCHCRLCQRAIGAAFNARVLYRREQVAITGPLQTYPSSPELRRGFCAACGTTLFSLRDSAGLIGVTTGSLDDPTGFAPAEHIWISSKQPWVELDDGLPQYAQGPPA